MRTNERLAIIESIKRAVEVLEHANNANDYKEVIDWAISVQVRTAELVTTVISEVRNR